METSSQSSGETGGVTDLPLKISEEGLAEEIAGAKAEGKSASPQQRESLGYQGERNKKFTCLKLFTVHDFW